MFCKTLVQPSVHKIVKGTTRMPTYSSIKVFKCLPYTKFLETKLTIVTQTNHLGLSIKLETFIIITKLTINKGCNLRCTNLGCRV